MSPRLRVTRLYSKNSAIRTSCEAFCLMPCSSRRTQHLFSSGCRAGEVRTATHRFVQPALVCCLGRALPIFSVVRRIIL